MPPSCPAGKCWEWESGDVFLNCPLEKPLRCTPMHILVLGESFCLASFTNLLKPPCRESVCPYTWKHSCTPSHTTNPLQVTLSESHLTNRGTKTTHLLQTGAIALNSRCFPTVLLKTSLWRNQQGSPGKGRGCKQSLRVLLLQKKEK